MPWTGPEHTHGRAAPRPEGRRSGGAQERASRGSGRLDGESPVAARERDQRGQPDAARVLGQDPDGRAEVDAQALERGGGALGRSLGLPRARETSPTRGAESRMGAKSHRSVHSRQARGTGAGAGSGGG